MFVIDLFSGLNGWGEPWKERGHTVISADNDKRFNADYQGDLTDVASFVSYVKSFGIGNPDVILASPPCDAFSVLNIGKNWTVEGEPKTQAAANSIRVVLATVDIIKELSPSYWIIENPVAKLRSLDILAGFDRRTVTYCQYGDARMKPTDLWGGFPDIQLKKPCIKGSPCHIRAPRGSKTSTQGMDKYLAAKIPYQLSLEICIAAEKSMGALHNGNAFGLHPKVGGPIPSVPTK